jgi:hypothetical protein
MSDEHAAVSAREAAQAFTPLRGGRRGLEAAEHAIEQRVDELLLGGEVVVQRHRTAPTRAATARIVSAPKPCAATASAASRMTSRLREPRGRLGRPVPAGGIGRYTPRG